MSKALRPVVITDPMVPHTHGAQSMKPYDGVVPSYVAVMDEYAERAGLTVRHRLKRRSPIYGDELMLAYAGTREQIARCELVGRPDVIRWPAAKTTTFESVQISPKRSDRWGNVCKLTRPLFAIVLTVCLPRAISTPCDGVECFDFYYDRRRGSILYRGTREALIAGGIGDADMFPDDGADMEITPPRANGYLDAKLEESTRLHNGLWAYLKYPHVAQEIEEEEQKREQADLTDHCTPAEFLRELASTIYSSNRYYVETLKRARTKHGACYSLTPEAVERARCLITDLYNDLQQLDVAATPIDVRSGKERKKAAELAAKAETDPAFKQFMREILPLQTDKRSAE